MIGRLLYCTLFDDLNRDREPFSDKVRRISSDRRGSFVDGVDRRYLQAVVVLMRDDPRSELMITIGNDGDISVQLVIFNDF